MKKSDFEKKGLDYDALNKEINLEGVDSFEDLVDKLSSRVGYFAGTLEELIQPDSLSSMHEANFLRTHLPLIQELYKELMKLHRSLLILKLEGVDDIKRHLDIFLVSWKKIKPDLHVVLVEMKESWNKKIIHNHKVGGYFG